LVGRHQPRTSPVSRFHITERPKKAARLEDADEQSSAGERAAMATTQLAVLLS
jgi:hypothetical protein